MPKKKSGSSKAENKNKAEDNGDFEDPQAEDVAEAEDQGGGDLEDPVAEMDDMLDEEEEQNETDGDFAETAYSEAEGVDAPENVLEAKEGIETFLAGEIGSQSYSAFDTSGTANIVGVGIGSAEIDMEQISEDGPGTATLNVYVAEPTSEDAVRAMLFDEMSVQAVGDDHMPVNIINCGPIDALAHRFKDRPAPGGISIGNARVNSAGTLGCLARGRRSPRNRRVLLLTNNHVAALSNQGRYGDSIVQPGRLDGGVNTRDRIAILERFITIHFNGRANYVDCATGWCWHRRVRRELVYISGGRRRYFRVASRPVACRRNMLVGKSGRTTQLRAGRVTDCNATIRVNYGSGRVALFRDQITIRGTSGQFSAPGDSGSLVWRWDRRRNPVGLLFAGGGGFTFANKIGRVLSALDINLYT